MDEKFWYGKQIPEYYPTMYMDGYTPQEILHAINKKCCGRIMSAILWTKLW